MQYPRIAKKINPISKIYASVENDVYCLNEEVCFSVEPDDAVTNYDWVPPKNTTIISGGRPFDDEICVRFDSIGKNTISVTPSSPCNQSQPTIRTFDVNNSNDLIGNITSLSGTTFCEGSEVCFDFQPNNPQEAFVWFTSDDFTIQSGGDTSQLTLCGQVAYSADGAIEIGVRPLDGCSPNVFQFPIYPRVPFTFLPTVTVCEENFPIEIDGEIYEQEGINYIVKSDINGCDSTLSRKINISKPSTGIFDDPICPEDLCVQIGDSCYDIASSVIIVNRPEPLCDSMVILVPKVEAFDKVVCTQVGDKIYFNWTQLSLADRYAININGLLDTVPTNQFIVEQLSSDSLLQFTVQPIGSCEFPDALSITCNFSLVGNQNQYLDSKIKVLPNPSDNQVLIETDLKIENVEIYDLTGRLIEQKNDSSFSLKKYGAGLYIFKIKTSEGVGVKRVVIQ